MATLSRPKSPESTKWGATEINEAGFRSHIDTSASAQKGRSQLPIFATTMSIRQIYCCSPAMTQHYAMPRKFMKSWWVNARCDLDGKGPDKMLL